MAQMYKIFINEHPLIITEDERSVENFSQYHILNHESNASILKAIETLEYADRNHHALGLILFTKDIDYTYRAFRKFFKVIKAAGGIVYNDKGEILLIKRKGLWDIPKGKIDKGESKKEAGVREVMEETNVDGIHLFEKIGKSYHCYWLNGVRVLKLTWWYRMTTSNYKKAKPQKEEKITEIRWVQPKELLKELDTMETYGSIREILKDHLEAK